LSISSASASAARISLITSPVNQHHHLLAYL
jgi:hypothetical protein